MKITAEQARTLLYEGILETSNGPVEMEEVEKEIDGEWRHGVCKRVVFANKNLGTLYAMHYREGPDGTGFLDNNYGDMDLYEVKRVTKIVTTYE